jgi:hypothetical protein
MRVNNCGVVQYSIPPLLDDGGIGNWDASGWPLVMERSNLLGVPTLSGLADVV